MEYSDTLDEAQGDLDAASLPCGGNWAATQIALEEIAGGSHWLKKE